MHTYEIYYAVTYCDSDWQLLGEVRADSEASAIDEAAQRWPEYSPGDLVALLVKELVGAK